MQKLEKNIEREVVLWAKANGWLAIKFTPKGEKGWPDRLFISPEGVHVWIEFKSPGNTPTDLQAHRIATLRKHNAYACWQESAEGAIEALKSHGA